jgi:hypothetical protein
MFHLTLAYVQQTARERDVESDLQARQLLRATSQTMTAFEPPAASSRSPRPGPASVRARAASR